MEVGEGEVAVGVDHAGRVGEKRIVRGVAAAEIVWWRIDLLSGLPQWRTA
jgi:hypothetical protein